MRRIVKQQLMESLLNIEATLRGMTQAADKQAALEICAQRMKTIIQTLTQAGAGGGMMAMKLRRFDQSLSRAIDLVDQPDAFAGEAATLAEQFTLVRGKVEKIQPKLEIVFLPYKASMWDSMESIWRAAMADKTCNAHVIPIPYYDLNVDLTIAKFYDESNLFPEDVPITDYRGYDLAKNRPDIIYFHNPYDGENLVTSVLPEFYSDKLKQYTDLLVYVPYFVEFGELAETLAQKPGCANADLIIAHSEANKKSYMEYYPAEKITVLGAPQIDKVFWTHEHRPELPEEWRRIAKGRKLILFNMSLISLMRKDGSACRKLRYVFSCFSGRQDVCLLWRPHPLSVATMNSMNERVLAEYQELIKVYREKKLGIYDDSPDVHRAIELSDAYYGDWSSLVPMYEATGKPVMIQDVGICEKECEEIYRNLSFSAAICDGDIMWFSADFFNGLFRFDLRTECVSFMGKFPEEKDKMWLHSSVVKDGNRLFFIPLEADAIAEFNIDTLIFTMHPVTPYTGACSVKFVVGFLLGDWISLIPGGADVALRFNILTGEMKAYSAWYREIKPFLVNKDEPLFAESVRVDEFVWCPMWQKNSIVIRLNLISMEIKVYKVGRTEMAFISMTYDGENFWIIPQESDRVLRWNPSTLEVKEYTAFPEEIRKEKRELGYCLYNNGYVWIFPGLGQFIIKLNVKTGSIIKVLNYPKGFKYTKKALVGMKFMIVKLERNVIRAYPTCGNLLLEINEKTGKMIGRKVCLSNTDLEKVDLNHIIQSVEGFNVIQPGGKTDGKSCVYRERRLKITVGSYVDYIMSREKWQQNFVPTIANYIEDNYGVKIHKEIIRKIEIV